MSTEIQAYTDADLAFKIVLLKTLTDLAQEEFDRAKGIADGQMAKGTTIPARTGDDVKLGKVTKSDPKPVPKIVDQDALDDWIRTQYPDKLDTRVELGDMGEILAVLNDLGRTDLFTTVKEIPAYLYKQAQAQAVNGRPIPGVELRTPRGVVSANKEIAAEYLVRQLLAASPVPLLGIEA
jgi:hypothetical protein